MAAKRKVSNHKGATYEDLAEDIDKISRIVAKDYPDIDWEDVRQELVLFILENGKSVKLKHEGGNPNWILRRVANDYCKKERVKYMALSPQYAYRPSDVARILETVFMNDPMVTFVPDDARSPLSDTFNVFDMQGGFKVQDVDPFHFIDAVDVASDVKEALKALKPDLKWTIYKRYVERIIPDNNSWERKKVNHAVNELTRKLNWYRGVTRRKAMSNAASRLQLSETYEGYKWSQ